MAITDLKPLPRRTLFAKSTIFDILAIPLSAIQARRAKRRPFHLDNPYEERPDRGRIIIVNFERGGTAVPPEMRKPSRPCVVLQNNKLLRGPLVTVVPLSTSAPAPPGRHHHQMSHLSFRDWPIEWSSDSPRWAKCDYVTTVALDRCHDPYHRIAYGGRRYVRVKAAKIDIEAIDRCVLWALGIDPAKYAPHN